MAFGCSEVETIVDNKKCSLVMSEKFQLDPDQSSVAKHIVVRFLSCEEQNVKYYHLKF